jgi:hypothetical protein
MTILAAVKTSTDLIIGADSKLTTSGFGGYDGEGKPIWLEQQYDYANKICSTTDNRWTVAIAGQAAIGEIQVKDIVESFRAANINNRQEQEADLTALIDTIQEQRIAEYDRVGLQEQYWPYTNLLLFGSDPEGRSVRAWNLNLQNREPSYAELLTHPGVWLAGDSSHALTLLYNHDFNTAEKVEVALGMQKGSLGRAFKETGTPPGNKINFSAMPIQDALDFAAFLVKTQILMQRFLPGKATCGGAIDLAVVHGLPKSQVRYLPGKEIHYPNL